MKFVEIQAPDLITAAVSVGIGPEQEREPGPQCVKISQPELMLDFMP